MAKQGTGQHTRHRPMRRAILQACAAIAAASSGWTIWLRPSKAALKRSTRWVVFYGQTADEQVLASYDIVVLDPKFKGSIDAVAQRGARVCAYLSLGEITTSDSLYHRVSPGALLEENPAWPGTRRIDVRDRSWEALLLDEAIPSIAASGFTGLLLDTLDTPPYLEQTDPAGNRGMRQAAVSLVQAIRRSFPHMFLIVNRGYALLPDLVDSIDAIVAESLLTTTDQHAQIGYRWNDPSEVTLQLSLLAPAMQRQARLPILSLDYWNPEDTQTIGLIYRRQRQLGHCPYVATRMLDRIVAAPSS